MFTLNIERCALPPPPSIVIVVFIVIDITERYGT